METPLDLVRRLAADEFASLRSEVNAGRVEVALKQLRQRDAGAEIVREQYAGRYPLELVQNANDAVAAEGATAQHITFRVTESALLVGDTGAGFGTAQVESICDLAQSSKDPRKSVGYKGLGFKSVAEITDTPQIISGDLRFGFDRARLRREVEAIIGRALDVDFPLPDYAFPFELSDADLGADLDTVEELQASGFRTVMRLPFRDDAAAAAAAAHVAETIVPRLLLFLDAAESLELVGTSADFRAQALRDGDDDQQYVILQAGDRSEEFMLYRKVVPIPDRDLVAELGKAWRQVEAVRIAAAVPLDDNGQPRATEAEPLHVYFPTEEETGLSIVFNADFQVELDRRRIASSGPAGVYNAWLCKELAEFVAEAVVPDLTARFGGAATVDVLAPHGPATHTGEGLTGALFDELGDVAWIPCRDGELRAPAGVWLLPASVPSVADAHVWLALPELVQAEVESDQRSRRLLVSQFDCREVSEQSALTLLEPGPESDAERYYDFLVEWSHAASYFFGLWLQACKCVQLQDGDWVRPSDDPKPFLPRQRAEDEFPPGLHIPVAELPDMEGVVDLLERAGMEPLTWRALVMDFLKPRLTERHVGEAERRDALATVRSYFDSISGEGMGDREIRDAVRDTLLPARNAGLTAGVELVAAADVYFGSDWLPGADLETLYGSSGYAEFLAVDSSDPEGDLPFYEWLGVQTRPAVVGLGSYDEPSSWRFGKEYSLASRCPQGHPNSQLLQMAPMIDRVDEVIDSGDEIRLSILWRHLATAWDSYYRSAMIATWRCIAGAHKGGRDRRFDSAAALLLKTKPWVPAVRSGRPFAAPPSDVWRPVPGSPSPVTRLLTTLAPSVQKPTQGMAEDLGFVDAARADSQAIVQLLERLEKENDQAALPDDVAAAATWLFARLEEAAGTESLAPGSVPIVARVEGERRLVRNPFLVRDPLLAEVWSDTVAIYEGDAHLPRVFDALEVPVLDDLVEVTAKPADRMEEIEKEVRSRLDEVGPALLATAAADYGSKREEIARSIRALRVVCTSELGLKYTLQGQPPRQTIGATAFIQDGTAYLAVDDDELDWSAFGLRLAEYLDVPLGDAFALLLDASPRGRQNYLHARHIPDEHLMRAAEDLGAVDEPLEMSGLGGWEYADELDPEFDVYDEGRENLPELQAAMGEEDTPSEWNTSSSGGSRAHAWGPIHEDERAQAAPPSVGTTKSPGQDAEGSQFSGSSPGKNSVGGRKSAPQGFENETDSRPISRFFSFVAAAGTRESRMAQRQDARAFKLGEHGVQRVVEYEAAHGRIAEPQPHNNKGFDLISRQPDGAGRRIIEVKATERDWPDRGVPVSDSQIEKNRDLGDEFWLYVVEHPEDSDSARVTAIQNPIAYADYFAFDPGWRAKGETAN